MSHPITQTLGPILLLDDLSDGRMHLSALFIAPLDEEPGPIDLPSGPVAPIRIADYDEAAIWRARFALPSDRSSTYGWGGFEFAVAGDLTGDLRLAYVSCNGEEVGDMDREGSERNAMWSRLRDEHHSAPFALLLHGGDQVYADEVTHGHPLSEDWPDSVPEAPDAAQLADLRHHLRQRFFARYAALYAAPELAWLSARVPSLMQWDDHDICDGWGSLRETRTRSEVGQVLFETATEAFLLFQQGCVAGDLPARFADPTGAHLGWSVTAGGLRILAPDLRGERDRHRIMGPGGWAMIETEAAKPATGHTMLMSSVPLLGPRMSLLETVMMAIPSMQKYEDDLRDQWQSRAHRTEWRRILRVVRDMCRAGDHHVTALSGEIHLATRAVMGLGGGRELHQLVASGISHRAPPKGWARFLGMLSWLGEDPLPDHPIRIKPLPGQRHRYAAERNFLTLDRQGDRWSARWHLEESGTTPPLSIGGIPSDPGPR
ncbi:alkaline phosphatase D family protein [Paracoccus sp. 1_MG-2023]|uniref:alkaline phosphatase D family protein n=1 Tax=unclassified Paracoccus (in: a-proteobacteria) TaxID=2688777 RepID=UPI001C0A47CA|nr:MULTISPECIES: alkaline phosphatase D family protein [unclassified Paracoccus (in: a-proteobacteria)]MBU2957835.1 alkaline phosphatase D family protein [Paracoccus sp. C2R09]MDO6667317.1 alkaline phosphatase D family protein [Paracoccus sp. 1_MG-2023]